MPLVRFTAAMVFLLLATASGFAEGWPPTAADISVTLSRGHGGCLEGNDCRLVLQAENLGTAGFKGRLSVIIETASASVPGFAASGPWRCERLGYGRMACAAAAIELAPAQTSTGLVSIRFLPTHMSEAEACASIVWRGTANTAARDALRSVAAALGVDAAEASDDRGLLSAVFGTWGEGDLRKGNDRGCVTVAIGPAAADEACPEGQDRIAGRCTTLDGFCSGNRERRAADGHCACPTEAPEFRPVSRSCAADAEVGCGGGRGAVNGLCFCPEATPLWNTDRAACEAGRLWKSARRVEEPEARFEPLPKPKVKKPVKEVEAPAPIKKRRVVQPSCRGGEVLRGGACVKPLAKTAKRKTKTIRLAQRATAKSPQRLRLFAGRCPPIFAICWPQLIIEKQRKRRALRR